MLAPTRTYGKLFWNEENRSWIIFGLAPNVSMRFKAFFGRIAKHETKSFWLASSPGTCSDLLWFMARYPLEMKDEARALLDEGHRRALAQQSTVESIMAEGWKPSPQARFRGGCSPYPFQAQAAEVTATLGRLLLMDDVGLGKTISALAALCQSGKLPAAVVVQAHLAEQWVDEYIKSFTTLKSHIIKGTKPYPLPPVDVYIFKYSNIAGWVDYAADRIFPSVIFDEVQELRHGAATAKGAAAKVFAEAASLRMGLTATPIYNYGSEIFNVVEVIEPGALGTWNEFLIEWCTSRGSHWVVKDPAALGTHLREATIAIRRTEADVDKQLPPVNVLMHHIDYDEAMVEQVEAEARVLALKVINGSFTERGQAARELDMMARHATGMAKAKGVAGLVRMLVESGEKVLLTGWHRDVYDVWRKELSDLSPVMYTGTESPVQKVKAKKAFIGGDARLMIISLRSGAGLDGLQRVCSKVVFGELDWSPQVHKQVIGRLRRPGQAHQVDAIYAHTNGGSDPVLVELLGLKASQSQGIVDPFSGAQQAVISDDSRIRKLAEAYIARAQA